MVVARSNRSCNHRLTITGRSDLLFRGYDSITSCARGDTICPRGPAPLLPRGAQVPRAPRSTRNVAVLSHAEYVPTLTAADALRVKVALSKAAW